MAIIKAVLFRSISFRATQDQVERLERTDFTGIAPFFGVVSFKASPYSKDVTLEKYKRVLLFQLVHLADPGNNKAQLQYREDGLHNAMHYMISHWDGRLPKTDREIEAGFKT